MMNNNYVYIYHTIKVWDQNNFTAFMSNKHSDAMIHHDLIAVITIDRLSIYWSYPETHPTSSPSFGFKKHD